MTEPPQNQQPPPSSPPPTEAEIAAAIALIVSGQAAVPDPQKAIAALLLMLAPAALAAAQAASVSLQVAALVVLDPPRPSSAGDAQTAASRDEWLYRGWYGVNAFKRVGKAVLGGRKPGEALGAERPHFEAHKEASKARVAGAALNDAAAERWGKVLGWNHGPEDEHSRPHHVEAHGKNYRVDRPPKETEGLPGTLLHCGCVPGPPIPGAEMLS